MAFSRKQRRHIIKLYLRIKPIEAKLKTMIPITKQRTTSGGAGTAVAGVFPVFAWVGVHKISHDASIKQIL